MYTLPRPALAVAALAAALAATSSIACLPFKLGGIGSREEALATRLHFGKYGNEIDDVIASKKLTAEEQDMLLGFRGRYSTEEFFKDKFPDNITVADAIAEERNWTEEQRPGVRPPK